MGEEKNTNNNYKYNSFFSLWSILVFFDMSISSLPRDDLISEVQSPNGTYIIKAYISSGGATTANAIRGELNFNNTRKKPKNIYWNYREDKAIIKWVDNNKVIINGHELDVKI